MVCPEGCGRGSAYAGQLLRVTPASWLKAPKRRRRERTTSLSLALGEGGRGRRRRDHWLGKLPCLASAQLLVATVARTQETPVLAPCSVSLAKAERKWGGEVSVLAPWLLRSFPGTFLTDGYLSHAFPSLLLE